MAAATGVTTGGRASAVRLSVGVGVAYFALAQGLGLLSGWITGEVFTGPVFWPAAGLALGLMLVTERSRWPVILAAVFVAEVFSNMLYQVAVPAMLGWATANVLHPWVAASLIRRSHPRFDLRSGPQLAAFVAFAGIVGPASSAAIGTTASVLWWNGSWSHFWGWLVGDGLGALVIAPLFVALRSPKVPRSSTEVVLGGGLLAVVASLVFRNWGTDVDTVLPYLVLPPLVWAGFRLGLRGSAFGVATVGMIGGWSTSLGYGPFAATSATGATLLFQIYLAVLVATALLIAVLVSGLTEREAIQREAERRQRQQAALAELGQRALIAEHPDDVLCQLGKALTAIGEPRADTLILDVGEERGAHDGTGREVSVGGSEAPGPALDPWEPLAAHREVLDAQAFVERHPIGADSAALGVSASTIAANALERLEQEARLRERADELEHLNAQLARAITFRERLVSMVSHELRSPLTPILGFTDLLRRSGPGEPTDPGFALDAIERNALRILSLIDELLLSARSVDGELAATPALTDVVATLLNALEHGFDDVEVTVEGPMPILALVDPGHLGQCVLNLVTNATKYGAPPVVVQVREDGPDHVAIEVSDQGEGVADATIPVLFDRFTQAEGSEQDAASGVGLGLSIVETFAHANGGSVSYRPPDATRPTTFVLRFPRAPRD